MMSGTLCAKALLVLSTTMPLVMARGDGLLRHDFACTGPIDRGRDRWVAFGDDAAQLALSAQTALGRFISLWC